MNWGSAAEFFAMGGYALYVWVSFGVCALVFVLEPWLIARRRRVILVTLQKIARSADLDEPLAKGNAVTHRAERMASAPSPVAGDIRAAHELGRNDANK